MKKQIDVERVILDVAGSLDCADQAFTDTKEALTILASEAVQSGLPMRSLLQSLVSSRLTQAKNPFVSDPEELARLLGFPYKEPSTIPSLVREHAEGCDSWKEFIGRLERAERFSDKDKKAALQWLRHQAKKLA